MAYVALLAGVLAGCSEAADDKKDAKTSASASASAGQAAESGDSIGAAGSACELPVSFDLAKDWEAEAIDSAAAQDKASPTDSDGLEDEISEEVLDSILRQGPVAAACEVDAKPAGYIGFLRIWTGEPGDDDARTVLEEFVAAEDGARKAKYTSFESGDVAGVEVEYVVTSELLDETKKESAFAVTTPDGPVVVHLGGMDTEEHEKMTPAFELAKKTLQKV
ncbi:MULTISPECIES: lipoprotein [unclassified Streptomyces]|uniref:lipoprotein n=1 Tax=unclassified Streptomyces TaxID=2593676 RepID=UPI00225008AC|nr:MULTISPECIES: lipoprotein [unclassified Streptomyces]MCX5335568.1 lipoprotein [Streptomyces sp. NBC_00140]MCX5366286.1 lipoprotein [Streptomyces sp. NBC_00124]